MGFFMLGLMFFLFLVGYLIFGILWVIFAAIAGCIRYIFTGRWEKQREVPTYNPMPTYSPMPMQPPSPQGPFDLIRDMQGKVRAERIDKIERFDNGRFRAERHDIIEGYPRGSIYLANVPYENIRQTAQAVYEERMRTGAPGDASSDWREAEERIVAHLWRQAHPINIGIPARQRR